VSGSPKSGKTAGDTYTVSQGAYAVSETGGPSGYAATFSGDCNADGAISVTVGQDKTCTITNNDVAPTVKVVKLVTNDDGGTASPADWQLHLKTGGTDVAGSPKSGKAAGDTYTVSQGAYAVSETGGPSGYAATFSGDCDGQGGVSVTVGQEKTCTVTNDDVAPTLTVVKHVVNKHGSTATAADFSMQITGTAGTPAPFDGSEAGVTKTLAAGTYAVTESGAATGDYAQSESADCSGSLSVGDEKTCTITNTRKTGTITVVKDLVPATDEGRFDLLVDETVVKSDAADGDGGSLEVNTGTHTVSEAAGSAGSLGNYAKGISCSNEQSGAGAGPLQVRVGDGSQITCTITNRRVLAQPVVVKAGDTFAYHGDTVSYTFAVSNTGNSPLHDVHVTDDKCPNVSSAPTSKSNDNGDAVLDPIGADGATPEVWVFTCSYQMGAHESGEANPVVNTATVTAIDELERPVSDTDQHATTLLHPAIALTKTGPASATAGSRIVYTIAASNTGDVAFPAALVVVTDARCEAPPLLMGTGTDASPATLDPGDTWFYACAVQTAVGETAVHNVAAVDGTDIHGRHATAQAVADTRLNQPPAAVLASGDPVLAPASAKLRGPTGCMPRNGKLVVTGKRIAQVTFTIDAKHKKTVKQADSSGRFVYSVPRSKLRAGTHRVRARVVYLAGSTATAKTLVMTLNKCPAAVKPAFTG
jgi:uncharacterized repeat protein (TIGR01451 family)